MLISGSAVKRSSCICSNKFTFISAFIQCEIEAISSNLSSSDTKSLRLSKEVSSLESQLNDAKVTK